MCVRPTHKNNIFNILECASIYSIVIMGNFNCYNPKLQWVTFDVYFFDVYTTLLFILKLI